jgi:hypothetical protein
MPAAGTQSARGPPVRLIPVLHRPASSPVEKQTLQQLPCRPPSPSVQLLFASGSPSVLPRASLQRVGGTGAGSGACWKARHPAYNQFAGSSELMHAIERKVGTAEAVVVVISSLTLACG